MNNNQKNLESVLPDSLEGWKEKWSAIYEGNKREEDERSFWNRRAASFAENPRKSRYSEELIALMAPQPAWTVLDAGCGSGTIALPIAGMVQKVTALDLSDEMLSILQQSAAGQNLGNIETHNLSWEDDWEAAGIGQHDLVIGSRSLLVADPVAAIEKMNRFACKKAVAVMPVGDGTFDRQIVASAGRTLRRGPDFNLFYNILCHMGILASVSFIEDPPRKKVFADMQDAFESVSWMLMDITLKEEQGLRAFLQEHLVPCEGGLRLDYSRSAYWAVMTWNL